MPLNVNDPEVDRLAAQVAELKRTTTTQAVKEALRHELLRAQQRPLWRRIAPLREDLARRPEPGALTHKRFFDDLN